MLNVLTCECLTEDGITAFLDPSTPVGVVSMKDRTNSHRHAGWTQKFKIRGQETTLKGYLRVSVNEDGTLHGFQIDVQREGAMARALLNAWAAGVNIGLQHGAPLESYVDMFRDWKFEPAGSVECSSAIVQASSIIDYVVRELEMAFLTKQE